MSSMHQLTAERRLIAKPSHVYSARLIAGSITASYSAWFGLKRKPNRGNTNHRAVYTSLVTSATLFYNIRNIRIFNTALGLTSVNVVFTEVTR